MFAELITIGDELLIGQVVDTNSAWMGRELNNIGIEVQMCIRDRYNNGHSFHCMPSNEYPLND